MSTENTKKTEVKEKLTFQQIIESSKFKTKIKEVIKRVYKKPNDGHTYKRNIFDNFPIKDYTIEDLTSEFVLIMNKESKLSSSNRKVVSYLVEKSLMEILKEDE